MTVSFHFLTKLIQPILDMRPSHDETDSDYQDKVKFNRCIFISFVDLEQCPLNANSYQVEEGANPVSEGWTQLCEILEKYTAND